MLAQSIKVWGRPKSSATTGIPWQQGAPGKWFFSEVWSVKMWGWAGDSKTG